MKKFMFWARIFTSIFLVVSVIGLARVSGEIEILGEPESGVIELGQDAVASSGGLGGNVTSVSSGDTYLVINPTTGVVVATINGSVMNTTIEQIASKYNESGQGGVDTWAGNLTSGLDESLFFKDNINASFGNSKADSDGWLYSDGNNLITQLRTITEVGFTSRPQIIYNKTKVTCFGGNCIYIPWTQYKNGITNGWGAIDKGLFLKSSDDQDPFIYIVGKNYGDETTTSTLINYDVSENITYISQGTSLFSFDFRTKTNFTDIVRMGQNLYVTQNISGGQNYRVNYPLGLKFTGGVSPGACSAFRASNYISPPYYTQNAGQQINFVISKADGTLDKFTINGRITNFNNSRNMTNGNLNYTLLIDGTRHLIGQQDFFATGDFNYTNYSMNLNVNQNSSVQAYLEYTKVNFSISNNNDFCYDYIYMDVEELYDR